MTNNGFIEINVAVPKAAAVLNGFIEINGFIEVGEVGVPRQIATTTTDTTTIYTTTTTTAVPRPTPKGRGGAGALEIRMDGIACVSLILRAVVKPDGRRRRRGRGRNLDWR